MKFYISGPITGMPNRNEEAFDKAAKIIREVDPSAVNPLELDFASDTDLSWNECLRRDIKYLMDCDAVLLLQGWEVSKGARLEVMIAKKLDMPFFRLNDNDELVEEHVAVDVEITPMTVSYTW